MPPFRSGMRWLTGLVHILHDVVVEGGIHRDGLVLSVEVPKLSESGFLDELLRLDSMEGQVDGPEELPRRAVVLVVVGEVPAEVGLALDDQVIEVLDWGLGEVIDWHRVGGRPGHVLS